MKRILSLILFLSGLIAPPFASAQKDSALPHSTAINADGRIRFLDPDDHTLASTGTNKTIAFSDFKAALSITPSSLGLGNVQNTALSTWPGSTNLTTLGAATAISLNGITLSSAANTFTLTVGTASITVAAGTSGNAVTDTNTISLTNKSISGTTNTIYNIPWSSVVVPTPQAWRLIRAGYGPVGITDSTATPITDWYPQDDPSSLYISTSSGAPAAQNIVPARAGEFLLHARVRFVDPSLTGHLFAVELLKNGTVIARRESSDEAGGNPSVDVTCTASANGAGDAFSVNVYQSSGSALNLDDTLEFVYFSGVMSQ